MDKLLQHKQSRASAGNGIFCIFDHEDISELAKQLCNEGKLKEVRTRNVPGNDNGRSFSYTVYRRVDNE